MKSKLIALIFNCQFLSNWKKVPICFSFSRRRVGFVFASTGLGSAADKKRPSSPIYDAMLAQTIKPSQADYQLLTYIV